MAAEREFAIDTPEGLRLHLTLAGLGERVGALIVDLLLLGLAFGALLLATDELPPATMALAGFALRYGYFFGFESAWRGATPGKRLLRLEVIARDGGSLDGRAILVRNLMRDAELFMPLYFMVGMFDVLGDSPTWLGVVAFAWLLLISALPLLSSTRSRAGDLLAGTVVVHVPRTPYRVDEASLGRERARAHDVRPHHLRVYGITELEALAELLRESNPLDPRSIELYARVAETIAAKVGYAKDRAARDPEGFLRAFYGAQRAYLEGQLLCGRRKLDKHHGFEGA